MTKLSDKTYEEFKKISDEKGIAYESESEMKRQANSLVELVRILVDSEHEEQARKRRLGSNPKGFLMPGKGRNCSLCGSGVYKDNGWYDKWGFKCNICQNAVNKKIIPGSMCGDYQHERCITDSTLAWKSKLHIQTIRKLIRQGKIKARQIPGGPYLILRKDNPDLSNVIQSS